MAVGHQGVGGAGGFGGGGMNMEDILVAISSAVEATAIPSLVGGGGGRHARKEHQSSY